jgi:hypothetical protein
MDEGDGEIGSRNVAPCIPQPYPQDTMDRVKHALRTHTVWCGSTPAQEPAPGRPAAAGTTGEEPPSHAELADMRSRRRQAPVDR